MDSDTVPRAIQETYEQQDKSAQMEHSLSSMSLGSMGGSSMHGGFSAAKQLGAGRCDRP